MVKRKAPSDLLNRYCQIAESPNTDAAATRFARAWGVARLCDLHSLPIGHSTKCTGDPADSIQAHKNFALCLASIRNIGLALNSERVGEDLDWQLADAALRGHDFPVWSKEMRSAFCGRFEDARHLSSNTNATVSNRLSSSAAILLEEWLLGHRPRRSGRNKPAWDFDRSVDAGDCKCSRAKKVQRLPSVVHTATQASLLRFVRDSSCLASGC
jgi:hypothetical protein